MGKNYVKSCQIHKKVITIAKFICFLREIELRENLVGTGFIDPPLATSEFTNRITAMGINLNLNFVGEIVSTSGFD